MWIKSLTAQPLRALLLLGLLSNLSGCTDRSLAPPADSEFITIQVKLPPELKPKTMRVMYRSADCRITRHYADGSPYQLDGHNAIYVQFQRQGQSDIYVAKLAKDGGGGCRWHLSNVTIEVVYREPGQFGANVKDGRGGMLIVIFDHNGSQQSGDGIEFKGKDLVVKEFYYPWVHESFVGEYRHVINLAQPGEDFKLVYTARNASSVYFEPVIYSDYVVYSETKKFELGVDNLYYRYPDGGVMTNPSYTAPDYRKLEAIRLGAERKK